MDVDRLLENAKNLYGINFIEIVLHRDMIGRVFILYTEKMRYVLKVYRSFSTTNAEQTACILDYLDRNEFPAVKIVTNVENGKVSFFDFHDGLCAAILFEYVDGEEPDRQAEVERIGRQVGELHSLMEQYPHELINRSKYEYVDEYIAFMRQNEFEQRKIDELEQYGDQL